MSSGHTTTAHTNTAALNAADIRVFNGRLTFRTARTYYHVIDASLVANVRLSGTYQSKEGVVTRSLFVGYNNSMPEHQFDSLNTSVAEKLFDEILLMIRGPGTVF